jgi:hypothetical protein
MQISNYLVYEMVNQGVVESIRCGRLLGPIPCRDKAERVTCRIGIDPGAVGLRLIVELRRAKGESA